MTIHAPPYCGGPNEADFQDDDIPLHDVDKPSRLRGPLTILGTTWLTCPQFLGCASPTNAHMICLSMQRTLCLFPTSP
jgi:hypothetical protein